MNLSSTNNFISYTFISIKMKISFVIPTKVQEDDATNENEKKKILKKINVSFHFNN